MRAARRRGVRSTSARATNFCEGFGRKLRHQDVLVGFEGLQGRDTVAVHELQLHKTQGYVLVERVKAAPALDGFDGLLDLSL